MVLEKKGYKGDPGKEAGGCSLRQVLPESRVNHHSTDQVCPLPMEDP